MCGQVGWHIHPPFLHDHDGVRFDLLTIEQKSLHDLATDAWHQSVAHAFSRRKDVEELEGIDWRVMTTVFRKLPAFCRKTLHVLQDGTFLDGHTHKKYDLSKSGLCQFCGAEDTLTH